MSGGHLENIGRPVVLENVYGVHFEEKKKKRLILPFFHRGRTLNMFFFLTLPNRNLIVFDEENRFTSLITIVGIRDYPGISTVSNP